MTRFFILYAAGVMLAACSSGPTADSFVCVRGPDLTAIYSDGGVLLQLNDNRDIALTRPDPARPNFYSAPGASWTVSERDARLNIDRRSFLCDKIS